ncbi:MAG: signal transduction histidine kinase [Proteobacteria bacterium]|nr:signal transduction histidine kinase [Pseudomonadota bacterium]
MASVNELIRKLIVTALVNTGIAAIIWALGIHADALKIWVATQCIGFSCMLISHGLHRTLFHARHGWNALRITLSVILGVPLGAGIAFLIGVPLDGDTFEAVLSNLWRYVLLSAAISLVFHFYYANQARLKALEQASRDAQLRELSIQKAALNAELRALQAQIEPHFLFNTLANLHSLIGRDAEAARTLLEQLNDYLRATLAHSRAERATLSDECRMLSAYLAIQAQRMGGRLSWHIDVADALQSRPFPPMLLQPLLENAIVHGVEPKLGNACVTLRGVEADGILKLAVIDDGPGFGKPGASGVGLANVRERLAALYGGRARLEIRNNTPSGVIAELWIPLDAPAP